MEMVLRDFLGSADLSEAQTLCIHKTMEVVMICKDKNLIFEGFHVVAPSFEYFNDDEKLIVMGFVLCFH